MSRNYIDNKITIWERIYIDDNQVDEILDLLSNGAHIDDLFINGIVDSSEMLYDTQASITIEQNNNQPTVALYKNDEIIWDNLKL